MFPVAAFLRWRNMLSEMSTTTITTIAMAMRLPVRMAGKFEEPLLLSSPELEFSRLFLLLTVV